MRRILAFMVLAAALVACGASAASTKPHRIVFGVGGGNMVPWQVTIEPTGRVLVSGSVQPKRHRLTRAKVAWLSQLVQREFASGLESRRCAGTNPDVGSDFIRAVGRTVTVHGSCERRFHRLWNTLAQAVGLRVG